MPISNPTQSGANKAAAFLTATDEAEALAMLAADRAKYVVVDWELPFRDGGDGSLAGRFQNLADWAGIPTSRYYSLCFSRRTDVDPWEPTWIYREAYYQTMAYRLMVLGGAGGAAGEQHLRRAASANARTRPAARSAKSSTAGSTPGPKKPGGPRRSAAKASKPSA